MSEPTNSIPCVKCGKTVPKQREIYVQPHCYGCIPEPPPIPTVRLAAREQTPSPFPPAAESYAECVNLGLLASNGDGTYRALIHGKTGPDDDGRAE